MTHRPRPSDGIAAGSRARSHAQRYGLATGSSRPAGTLSHDFTHAGARSEGETHLRPETTERPGSSRSRPPPDTPRRGRVARDGVEPLPPGTGHRAQARVPRAGAPDGAARARAARQADGARRVRERHPLVVAYATEEILQVAVPAVGVARLRARHADHARDPRRARDPDVLLPPDDQGLPDRRRRVHRHQGQLRAAARAGRRRRAAHRLHPHRRRSRCRPASPPSPRPSRRCTRTASRSSVAFIWFIAWGNLRGVQESGRMFAVPTYFFIVMMFVLLGDRRGQGARRATSHPLPIPPDVAAGADRRDRPVPGPARLRVRRRRR